VQFVGNKYVQQIASFFTKITYNKVTNMFVQELMQQKIHIIKSTRDSFSSSQNAQTNHSHKSHLSSIQFFSNSCLSKYISVLGLQKPKLKFNLQSVRGK